MKIQITAGGIYGAPTEENPSGELPIGAELTVDEMPAALAGRYTVLSGGEGKTLTVNPAQEQPTGGPPYEVKEASPGWYQIYDAAGAEVGKKLRKDDADAFAALSAEDQAEFVKADA